MLWPLLIVVFFLCFIMLKLNNILKNMYVFQWNLVGRYRKKKNLNFGHRCRRRGHLHPWALEDAQFTQCHRSLHSIQPVICQLPVLMWNTFCHDSIANFQQNKQIKLHCFLGLITLLHRISMEGKSFQWFKRPRAEQKPCRDCGYLLRLSYCWTVKGPQFVVSPIH